LIWAAENGHIRSRFQLAQSMYEDFPYARKLGLVSEAAGVATSAGVMEGHDVPQDVLTVVMHWLRKGCATGQRDPLDELDGFRRAALEGAAYCYNVGCTVVRRLQDFKVCPQCRTARYCGEACQKQDWNYRRESGHKDTCGTYWGMARAYTMTGMGAGAGAEWGREAARGGDADAQYLAGKMFARGEGVQKDLPLGKQQGLTFVHFSAQCKH